MRIFLVLTSKAMGEKVQGKTGIFTTAEMLKIFLKARCARSGHSLYSPAAAELSRRRRVLSAWLLAQRFYTAHAEKVLCAQKQRCALAR